MSNLFSAYFPLLYEVALLAKNIGCSLEEKVKFVETSVYPKHVVKYLIVDGDRSLRSLSEEHSEEDAIIPTNNNEDDIVAFNLQDILPMGPNSNAWIGDDSDGGISMPLDTTRDYSYYDRPSSYSFGVMHVSSRNGAKLLNLLQTQSQEKENVGGPRIILDGGWRVGNRQVILWMAVSALLSACACTFLLVVHNGSVFWFQDQEPPQQQQPPRDRRRRLTREQVRRLYPPYIFDGTKLEPYPVSNSTSHGAESGSSSREPLLAADAHHREIPDTVELCCCSICLDDYEPGDKLRCLPCNHAFHYRYVFFSLGIVTCDYFDCTLGSHLTFYFLDD